MRRASLCFLAFLLSSGSLAACGPGFEGEDVAVFEIVPTTLPVGATAELRGQNLGETQGAGWVSVGGVPAPVQAWVQDRIQIAVPEVGPGEVLVVVSWPDHRTEPVSLTVLP